MIQNGKKIAFEYTVFLMDGTPIDSNVGEEPLVIQVGSGEIFPALEKGLAALNVGQQKEIELKAKDAYGPIVQDAFREVDIGSVPEKFRFEGAILGIQDPAGGVFPIRVHAVRDATVVLDFNHPLAGKDLKFSVKVLRVE
jgi:FKBP-type peptidyl-prolyl cis-trans isomerase 2